MVISSVNNKEYIKTIKQLFRSNQNSPFQKVVGFFNIKNLRVYDFNVKYMTENLFDPQSGDNNERKAIKYEKKISLNDFCSYGYLSSCWL